MYWIVLIGTPFIRYASHAKRGQYLTLMRATLWPSPIRTYHPSTLLFLVICIASQSQFKTKANKTYQMDANSESETIQNGRMLLQRTHAHSMPIPSQPFPIDLIHWHKPIKAVLQLTKFTKRNSYILICKPQHETEAPMIPDARHTWIWTVHLKVPGGNHRALVLQKYMTKSIQNSFLTIEFVSWWSFQQTSTN